MHNAGEVLPAIAAADAEITSVLGQLAEQGAVYRARRGSGKRKSQCKVSDRPEAFVAEVRRAARAHET